MAQKKLYNSNNPVSYDTSLNWPKKVKLKSDFAFHLHYYIQIFLLLMI